MKRVYLLIVVFLVACIAFSEVYIYQVKGGKSFFEATAISAALWIIECLLMLVAACIIGMSIGWYLRDEAVAQHLQQIDQLQEQSRFFSAKAHHFQEQAHQHQLKLVRAQESFKDDFRALSHDKEMARTTILSLQSEIENRKNESAQLQTKIAKLERELQLSMDSNVLLQINLDKWKVDNANQHDQSSFKPFTMPAKDDLKLISGIGPAIERKLNGLGIYSFRQISEFTPRTINEIAAAIRFFPGRIERDNWVSQARNFEAEKRRQN